MSFKLTSLFLLCMLLGNMFILTCQQTLHDLNSTTPIQSQMSELKATLEIAPTTNSLIQGLLSIKTATNVKTGYTTPTFSRSLTAIAFLSIDLTQVYLPQNDTSASNEESTLYIKYTSFIPTFFNLDPTSFALVIYDEVFNMFSNANTITSVNYGVSIQIPQAFNKVITVGVFAYQAPELVQFSNRYYVYYPRVVMLSIGDGNGLYNLAFGYPNAQYSVSSVLGKSVQVLKLSTPSSLIPSTYAVLSRVSHLGTSGLDFNGVYISVSFQTSSNYFKDISGNTVEVDPSTMSCSLFFNDNLYNPISSTIENGVLTCFLSNLYPVSFQLFIKAKLKNPVNPVTPTPSPSSNNGKSLTSGVKETLNLAVSQQVLFKITLEVNQKVDFVSVIVAKGAKPTFYIATNYIPSVRVHDQTLDDGYGTVKNWRSTQVTVYLLIVNGDTQTSNVFLTPTVKKDSSVDPDPYYSTGGPSALSIWWYIAVPSVIVFICVVIGGGIVFYIIYIRKRKQAGNHDLGVELIAGQSNHRPQLGADTQYYRVK